MARRGLGAPIQVVLLACALLFGLVPAVFAGTEAPAAVSNEAELRAKVDRVLSARVTQEEREAAAARMKLMQSIKKVPYASKSLAIGSGVAAAAVPAPGPGGVPDYFGSTPNWAYSPLLRKFVDGLPGLGADNANNLGQYLTVAKPDTITYPGSDYYEIELREYSEQLHSDLPATRLRGYVQVNKGTDASGHNTIDPDPIHYLGPTIFATKDRPVRVKFTNKLAIGEGGDLFIPVDTSVMGAGTGPTGEMYTQNRATLHLHGGVTPWISDGTPHQWITPAGEDTPYPKGVSVKNVPDMPDPGDGSMTFFYSNQQSARMLWVHDHSFGITRLNVYAGEAQAYLLTDDTEKKLISDGTIPAEQIPLVIQDKTFVDSATIGATDPTWNWGTTAPIPNTGDLWVPHVYVPAQNPADPGGMNATGRWHYGPWFWPPVTSIKFPPIPNPYYDPINAPWEPPLMPATPNPSMGMEAYNDTPLVNGTPYPVLEVDPKAYRLRILNAANDRFFNLQMYVADGTTVSSDGRRNTEVKMIPAASAPGAPELWPTDGRVGGVPDFNAAGPEWIQIGAESGFLPAPAIIPQQPISWNTDPTTFNMGNVQDHSLLLGTAERADVVVDFSQYAGKTLILYNDAPTAFPALDQRTDYFTGNDDLTDTGGTKPTEVGFGPNTRTIMQIKVAAAPTAQPYDLAALQAAFASSDTREGVFEKSQKPILVPDARYGSAYNATTFTVDPYVRIYQTDMTFKALDDRLVNIPLQPKAIQDEQGETFDPLYGRMSAKLGLEMPQTNATNANFLLFGFIDPPTENIDDASMTPLSPIGEDGTQIWKITHNGVDTHPVHFHLFDVQLINRVGWDGAVRAPDDNELGWKDTIRISPLEDTIVALRAEAPKLKFGVPDSIRPLNPAEPIGSEMDFAKVGPDGQPVTVINKMFDFGWEYVWHCHILSHEEMDMMRPVAVTVARSLPAPPSLAATGVPGVPIDLKWIDPTPALDLATLGNSANEIGFRVERADVTSQGVESSYTVLASTLANVTAYEDTTTVDGQGYLYRVIAFNAAGEVVSNVVRVAPPAYFAVYYITPVTNVGGTITPAEIQAVPVGTDSATFTIAPDPGYHLLDVLVDGVSVGLVDSYRFTGVVTDHTIWALFAPDSFTVTSSTGANGVISPGGPQSVLVGADSPPFAIMPNVGYHVADVLVDGVSVGALSTYTFTNVQADHTISATFAINTFTITPTAGVGGAITPGAPQTVNYGGGATFAIAADPGYHLVDVAVNGVSVGAVTSYVFTNVTANHAIAATFALDPYVITPSAGPNGVISPATPQSVIAGSDSAPFTFTPIAGYHVADVKVDGISIGAVGSHTFTNVQASHTIAATFAIDTFTITPTAGAGGVIAPATQQTLDYGGGASFAITPNVGYHIVDVKVDGASVGAVASYVFTNVQANHTIAATFAIDTFTITPSAGANGSIVAATPQTVGYGSGASFAITPNAGYHVLDVLVDGISVGPVAAYAFTNVQANHTIAATFAIDAFTITPTAGSGGTISPATAQTVYFGGGALFTIAPSFGYGIADVLVDGISVGPVNSYLFTNVSANHTISVTFRAKWMRRISGKDRYGVSLATAAAAHPGWTGVTHLVVIGGVDQYVTESFGAPGLAGVWDAPLLMVPNGTSLRSDIKAAVASMPAGLKIHIVGGTGSVSSRTQTLLAALPNVASVDRIAGADRYKTAIAVAKRMKAELGDVFPKTVLIVSGDSVTPGYDGMVAASVSARKHFPVLLVTTKSVPLVTASALFDLGLTERYVVGGPSVLSEGVRSALGVAPENRIHGIDKYKTAVAMAEVARAAGWLKGSTVAFAGPYQFDAVNAATFIGSRDGVLLYVAPTSVTPGTASYLTASKAGIMGGYVIGTTAAVSETVRLQLLNYIK